jgi:hypothetical protein
MLEVDWWIIHRHRVNHPAELQRVLAEVQSGNMSEGDWAQIGVLLDRSWSVLRTAVAQSPVEIRSLTNT